MMASSLVLFVLSGLFLMNTVVNPPDSFPYLVGKVLCFGAAPLLLILGIIVFVAASKDKKRVTAKQSKSVSSAKEPPKAASPTLLLARRAIGLILGFAFFVP
ncbi:MAG: hypothetical protein ABSD68_01730, partial [Candidatus Micrarchaeales archaeon]